MNSLSKKELRAIYREKRINLDTQEFRELNDRLMNQVRTLDFARCATIHLFLPIAGNREPDTYAVAQWLRQQYPRIRLVLPRTDDTGNGMTHWLWDGTTTLTLNRWGIPEPHGGVPIAPAQVDAVFVPLLAFDVHGNRVGYGKGFYDRFLGECRPEVLKIGLSLFEPGPVVLDTDAHDILLDACVTPGRVWWFSTEPGI